VQDAVNYNLIYFAVFYVAVLHVESCAGITTFKCSRLLSDFQSKLWSGNRQDSRPACRSNARLL